MCVFTNITYNLNSTKKFTINLWCWPCSLPEAMSTREVPSLALTALKCISKKPPAHLTADTIARAFKHSRDETRESIAELVVAHVTDAGRYVDDAIPVTLFHRGTKYIDIKNSKVSGVYVKLLVDQCSSLEELNVAGCFQVDDSIVNYILQRCRNLKKLCIQNCRKLTDQSLSDICESGLLLTSLDIGGNMNLTEQGLVQFLRKYPNAKNMKELNLSGLPVTQAVLVTLIDKCRSLDVLGIGYALAHEDTVKLVLKELGPKLKSLNISWMLSGDEYDNYGYDFFEVINSSCRMLTTLDLCGMRTVTAATLQKFLDARVLEVCNVKNEQTYIRANPV